MRVAILFGTRPEAIKLAPVILCMRNDKRFQPVVCVTGQHREMLDQTLGDFSIAPDVDMKLMVPEQTLAGLSVAALEATSRTLAEVKPDAVVVQGDTTSAMIGALAAFYAKIPVGHVEAGLRTGRRYDPFPEEINRKLISALATWHYAPTTTAVNALLAEGIDPHAIVMTGNTVVDALKIMSALVGDSQTDDGERLILVTAHRRESFGLPFRSICMALRDLARDHPDVSIVYPVHLNPQIRKPAHEILGGERRIKLIPPVSYRELISYLKRCYLVLTDSGGIQEEAPVFGKPVLVLREVTERPEAVMAGTVKVIGTDRESIVREVGILLKDRPAYSRMSRATSPYGDGHAARRIVEHLAENIHAAPPIHPDRPELPTGAT